MELTKKNTEFFTILFVICLVTAVAVMVVDFGIKAAILEESNALKKVIDRERNGRQRPAKDRASDNGRHDSPYPSDLLGNVPTRVEEGPYTTDD